MTCAEARRRLPGPEEAAPEAVAAHLEGCDPCRAEVEALREVDRRLERLGAYRLLSTAEQVVALDRQLGPLLGAQPARRPARFLWLGLALLGALLGLALAYRWLR
jgi:anti-sigma factor RsiW